MITAILQVPSIPQAWLDWVMVIQAFGSLILSILIIIVYVKISRLQDVQTDILGAQTQIMDRQNTILSAEYLPDISGELYRDVDWSHRDEDITNMLHLKLTNHGRGKGKNLFAMVFTYRLGPDSEIGESTPQYLPTAGLQSAGWGFIPAGTNLNLRQENADTSSEDMIPPDGKTRHYFTEFEVVISRMLSDAEYRANFQELIKAASKEWDPVEALGFEIFVTYTDETGRLGHISVCSLLDIPLEPSMSLQEAINEGRVVNLPMSYFLPEEVDRYTPDFSDIDFESGTGILDLEDVDEI